jgi:hypothetical protein
MHGSRAQAAERNDELAQANQWYEGQLREHVALVQAEREQAVRLEQARAEAWVEIGALAPAPRCELEAQLADAQVTARARLEPSSTGLRPYRARGRAPARARGRAG